MSAPLQPGDAITGIHEFYALPAGALAVDRHGIPFPRRPDTRDTVYDRARVYEGLPMVLLYLPGQPPRPERIVKAEALREAAEDLFLPGGVNSAVRAILVDQAARLEKGEAHAQA